METLLTLIPLGIVGAIRWCSWSFRRLVSMFYRPTLPGFVEPLSLVVPVYQEDPEIFRLAIRSWLRNQVTEVICVIDVTDVASMAVADEFAETGRVRAVCTEVPGKRDALALGWRHATTPLVALVDSDTIWEEHVALWVMAPFADPSVGGVGTRQNVHQPRRLWQHAADMYLDYRYYDEIPAQSALGQAVSCLSGRTAVYRRELLERMEDDFLSETFLGVKCMSGDDKRLTTLLLEMGYKTVLQREARVWSTFPDNFRRFILQRVRWARNTWRSDLRAMRRGWIWSHKFLAYTTVDKAVSSFTLLVAPTFMVISIVLRAWTAVLILGVWWLVSRCVKLLPHFRRRPKNLPLLPAFIAITIIMAFIKIYALATIRQQRWLTRDVAVVDGAVQRTTHGAPSEPQPEIALGGSAA
jgi:cellulose synthase/poly-beta-1,6-N-acetylglucosamine synthase-like glycosyltransferase